MIKRLWQKQSPNETDSPSFDSRSKKQLALVSLCIAALSVFLLCWFFVPKWETIDDVGMSMIAHGYGIALVGSPNILFSNVLWGHLVRLIPEINGVLGYSSATLGVLVIVGTVTVYGMFRSGVHFLAGVSLFALLLLRPVLFPQFTLNSGFLLVAAVVCWHLYSRENDKKMLVLGGLLAFLSYLIRDVEFAMVFVVAISLLPSYRLLARRSVQLVLLALVSAITIAAVVDSRAYQGPEWTQYRELNVARAPFTDYGAGSLLKQRPDILARHGYSTNDIDLISGWFFVDPNLANPRALKSMLTELGPLPTQVNALTNAWNGLQALWSPPLLVTLLAALVLAIVRPSKRVAASWGLCIAIIFVLGLMRRPGIIRVYVPMVGLLLIAPLLDGNIAGWRNRLTIGVLLVAALVNSKQLFSESRSLQIAGEQTRKTLSGFPHSPVVIWGATFPYDAVYLVVRAPSSAMSYQHYGMGTSTLAPFTLAYAESKAGRGVATLLAEGKQVSIMASPPYVVMLEKYCGEHLHGQLSELSRLQMGSAADGQFEISQRRCVQNQ